jgi:Zn-dependent protease with chaperone function
MTGDRPPRPGAEPSGAQHFETIAVRGAWPARRDGVGRVDPRTIRAHRFPHERLALAVALFVVLVTIVVAYLFVSQQAAALVVAGMLAQVVVVRFQVKSLVGRGAEVTPAQFAGLHTVVRRAVEGLDVPPTRVFVVQDPNPNAFSFGFARPYGVVLTSALVEALDDGEMTAVLGHELGHVKLGHTKVSLLFGGVDVPLGIPFVQFLVRAPFLWWLRCAELSADRASFAVCGRVSKIISSLVKVAVGPRLYDQVRPDELARQAAEFYRGPWAIVSQLQSTHPFLISRIQQIVDFAGPPEAGHQLQLARPEGLTVRLDRLSRADSIGNAADSGPGRPGNAPAASAPIGRAPAPPASASTPSAENTADPPAILRRAGAARRAAWLSLDLPDGSRRRVPLVADWLTAGRGSDNDLVLADPRVSHRHFGINWDGAAYAVHDLSSRNGTSLNGKPIRQAVLHEGDEIQVGGIRLSFSTADG